MQRLFYRTTRGYEDWYFLLDLDSIEDDYPNHTTYISKVSQTNYHMIEMGASLTTSR